METHSGQFEGPAVLSFPLPPVLLSRSLGIRLVRLCCGFRPLLGSCLRRWFGGRLRLLGQSLAKRGPMRSCTEKVPTNLIVAKAHVGRANQRKMRLAFH